MNRLQLLAIHLTAIVLVGAAAPADGQLPALDKAAAEKVSFRGDVWPILKRHCWGCHSGSNPKGGLSRDSVATMLKGGESGALFERGKPGESLLLDMITGDEPAMPKKQPPLSVAKIQILRGWVLAGAKDDSKAGDKQPTVRIPETYKYAPAVTSVAYSPDGRLLAAACRSEVVLIDAAGSAPPKRLPTECDLLTHVEFSPDGKLLAAVGGAPTRYGEVLFFNPADGKLVSSRRAGHDTLFRGNFSPDGQAIALGGADGAIHIVPVDDQAKVRRLELHSDWVFDVAYTPDGKLLVSGGRDKATKVSSVETGKLLRSVDSSSELISSVASDDKFAVSSGRGRTLIGYEYKIALSSVEVAGAGNTSGPVSNRNQYAKDFENQPGEVLDIATSGDRKLVAVAGKFSDVRVYQLANRKRLALIGDVPTPIFSAALNGDGSRLAIGSASGQVQIYELPAGKLLKSFVPVPVEGSKNVAAK